MSANPKNPSIGIIDAGDEARLGDAPLSRPSFQGFDALQALLAFSSLHEQIRQKRALEARSEEAKSAANDDVWELEHFVLDEVLQLVADRALAITGADGIAIALAEDNSIVCRASAGIIAPDAGVRLDPNSGFSGACLRRGEIVRCDDSENDPRVNVEHCRRLGARSMVAVPLSTRQSVVGLIEAFSTEAFGFNDSDVRSLNLLAELILAALRPEEEERLAEISQRVVGNGSVAESVPARGAVVEDTVVEDKDVPEIAASASEVLPETAIPDESEKSFEDSVLPILAGIRLIPRNDVSEVSLPTPDDVIVGDNEKLVAAGSEALPEFEALERSNPGLKVVLVLVVLALLVGAGVWWKLQHDATLAKEQLSRVPVQSVAPVQNDASQASGAANSDSDNAADSADARKPGAPAEVTGIRHWSSGDSSTVAIDLQDQVQYEAHRLTNPERIYFDLHDTTLAGALDGKTISVDDAFLVKVRVAQPEAGLTRVVLETKGNPAYSVSLEQNPYRLLVEIRKQGAPAPSTTKADLFAPSPTGSFSGAATSLKSANVGLNQSSSQQIAALQHIPSETQTHATNAKIAPQFRIVLDAGHGGWDLGTVGRKGLLEKDLVLDIVDRLGKLVQSKLHAEVIYTRTDDTYLPLEKRAEIANVSHADLFLSIHANYSDLTSARGVETYYTNTYSSVRARTAEASAAGIPLQNANLQSGGDLKTADLKNVNWTDVDIRAKVKESHRFAASIQRSLYGTLEAKNPGLRDRGVKEASYVVLTGTSMPAVLAEVSFVSSPTDETELQNAAYRQEIAEALYKGLAHYTESTQKVKMASSTTGTAIKK